MGLSALIWTFVDCLLMGALIALCVFSDGDRYARMWPIAWYSAMIAINVMLVAGIIYRVRNNWKALI